MGAVYLAERADATYSQQVAIKVMQASIATGEALERFVRERQTLARLNHPGIARLLDGGVTEDGRPYLVMEYVEGRLLHQFCDEEKLNVRERIGLFIRICEAVQSAHQNLIIHRDLKPGNILVTQGGEPKLLDFGIAKWLDDAPKQSHSTIQILTPSYASPEQACHQAVSTATDVYSLGVLLFELLSGSLPHEIADLPPHEALRKLAEGEPRLASEAVREDVAESRRATAKSLRRSLKGDLDTILQQALRREPERRYATVQAFATDLNRYLGSLPVQARADTLVYRVSKFVRRRKTTVSLAAALIAAMAIATVGMWHAYKVAQAQRAISEHRYENGRKLVQAYLSEVDRKLEAIPGTAEVRGLIAHRNLEYLDRMAADAKGDLPLERELAQAYFLIARTQRLMAESNADREQARIDMDKAVQLRRTIFGATGDIVDRGQLAYLLSQAGALLVQSGRLREAVQYHQHACALAQPILRASPKGLNYLRAANACWNLATDYIGNEQAPYTGRFSEGLQGQLETLERFKRWRDANPDSPIGYPYVASMESMTASDFWRMGRYDDAAQHFEAALSILHGPHGLLSHDLSVNYLVMAQVDYSMMLTDQHRAGDALGHSEEALSYARKQLAAERGHDPGWESTQAFAEVAMGRDLVLNGRSQEGLGLIKSGLATLRAFYKKDPSDSEGAAALARCGLWAIDAEGAAGAGEMADRQAKEVVDLATAALRQDPDDASARENLRQAQAALL
jgi:non-specific serine/threonine protein kinase/serine/threonine-protein kinase